MVVDLLAGSCICTWNKLIKTKEISPLTFFLKKNLLILKLNAKVATGLVLKKKLSLKLFEYFWENTCVGVSF